MRISFLFAPPQLGPDFDHGKTNTRRWPNTSCRCPPSILINTCTCYLNDNCQTHSQRWRIWSMDSDTLQKILRRIHRPCKRAKVISVDNVSDLLDYCFRFYVRDFIYDEAAIQRGQLEMKNAVEEKKREFVKRIPSREINLFDRIFISESHIKNNADPIPGVIDSVNACQIAPHFCWIYLEVSFADGLRIFMVLEFYWLDLFISSYFFASHPTIWPANDDSTWIPK